MEDAKYVFPVPTAKLLARLACVKHAASVHPEPGSNSFIKYSLGGGNTVIMPLGGKYQLSPAIGMAAKLPVVEGETDTASFGGTIAGALYDASGSYLSTFFIMIGVVAVATEYT